jgi:hypothetical protein
VFHKKPALNYRLLGFNAKTVSDGVLLSWTVENEASLTGFSVQRNDGKIEFLSLYSLKSDGSGTYTYLDKTPFKGLNNYRILQNDPFGTISYSKTIAINFNDQIVVNTAMALYPNPVAAQLQITINQDQIPAIVQLRILSATGQTVLLQKVAGTNIAANTNSLLPGTYIAEVVDEASKKLIGRKKFVKQ